MLLQDKLPRSDIDDGDDDGHAHDSFQSHPAFAADDEADAPPPVVETQMDVVQLMDAAYAAQPFFNELMEELVKAAGLSPNSLLLSELKPRERARAKIKTGVRACACVSMWTCELFNLTMVPDQDYDGHAERLVDAVRCSVVADSEEDLIKISEKLLGPRRGHG